jgi:hypothetical protein
MEFERGCPIAWQDDSQGVRTPPQLDVVIEYESLARPGVKKAIAIESKFREPYGPHNEKFADCYLARENERIWQGLERLREIAVSIQAGEWVPQRLKVDQLIKHILGLNSVYEGKENFELLYLWYPAPGHQACVHQEEIDRFRQATQECVPEVRFQAINYHDLLQRISVQQGEAHGAYVDYLLDRYL